MGFVASGLVNFLVSGSKVLKALIIFIYGNDDDGNGDDDIEDSNDLGG